MKFMIVGKTGCFLRELGQELSSLGLSVKWYPESVDVKNTDVVFIQPEKIRDTADADPESCFCITYLTADNEARSKNSIYEGIGGSMFRRVAKKERSAFAELENWIESKEKTGFYPQNITTFICLNPLKLDVQQLAVTMARHIKKYRKCLDVIKKCVKAGTIQSITPGKVLITSADGKHDEIPYERFTEQILGSVEGRASLFDAYLETEMKVRFKNIRSGKNRQVEEYGLENNFFRQMSLTL